MRSQLLVVSFIIVSLYGISSFPQLLKIFSLILAVSNLFMMCLGVVSFVFIRFSIHWVSWVWKLVFHQTWKVFSRYLFRHFFLPLSFSPHIEIQWHIYCNTWYYLTDGWSFLHFPSMFFLSVLLNEFLLIHLPLTDSFSISYLLLIPSTEFFISVLLCSSRISVWFLFKVSFSLVRFPVFHSLLASFNFWAHFLLIL